MQPFPSQVGQLQVLTFVLDLTAVLAFTATDFAAPTRQHDAALVPVADFATDAADFAQAQLPQAHSSQLHPLPSQFGHLQSMHPQFDFAFAGVPVVPAKTMA